MSLTSIVFALLVLLSAGDDSNRPPPLTFRQPVDYVGWLNGRLSDGKTDNAFPLYKGFYPDAAGNGGIPPLQGAAKQQYDEIGMGDSNVRNRVWDAKRFPALAAHLQDCSGYLDAMKKAAKKRGYFRTISSGPKELFEHVGANSIPILHGAKMIHARAWMRQDNQAEATLNAQKILLRASDHIAQNGFVLDDLLSVSARSLAYHSVLSALHQDMLVGDDIGKSYQTFLECDPGSSDWSAVLNHEWAFALDMLQFLYPNAKLDDARRRTLESAWQMSYTGENGEPGLDADPRPTVKLLDKYYGELIQIVRGAPRAEKAQAIRAYVKQQSRVLQKNAFMRKSAGMLARAYEITVRGEAQRRGTMLALAIRAHHAKHGSWPESLKRIDKKMGLKDIKKFRIDPFSGKYFQYRVKNSEALFYSMGADGKDDGGRHDPKWGESEGGGDYVFWPPQR